MPSTTYKVIPYQDGWGVECDGAVAGPYATKEAALEAAVGSLSNAIKEGLDITLTVPGRGPGESALGAS
jgi:hypothetical protein